MDYTVADSPKFDGDHALRSDFRTEPVSGLSNTKFDLIFPLNQFSRRARRGLVVGLAVAYLLLYALIHPALDRAVPILAIFPIVAAAWLLGFRAGVTTAFLAFPINVVLELTWLKLSLIDVLTAPGMWMGHGALLFTGAVVGALRKAYDNATSQRKALADINVRLDDEIREHRRTEERLEQAISNLESLVSASPAPIAALDPTAGCSGVIG